VGKRPRCHSEFSTKAGDQTLQEGGGFDTCRRLECEPHLEPTPRCSIEQFSMVGGANHDDMRREAVNLQEERRDDTLDLSCFVGVASLFGDRVELIEEEDAPASARELEHFIDPPGGLTQEA